MLLSKRRRASGATTALVVACTLLIILAIVAAFKLSVYLGSSQEMKNSVDAGALNVAKRIFQIKVSPPNTNGPYGYGDVADSQQMIGLSNINRVWGKAYLVNANAQAMAQQGYGSGGNGPAQAVQDAETINNALYGMVTNKAAIYTFFNQLVAGKPAKLLGTQGNVAANDTSDWATGCLYRGEESNLQVLDAMTIPPNVTPNLFSRFGQSYLQGYNPSVANNYHFCFVTFHANEAPHLVANSTFDQWQKATVSNTMVSPLPNAFKESGEVNGTPSFIATASAVANPMRTFTLAIPHSYVMITLTS
ncbi:MAG TPA: hypothetical protein V6C72_18685, partial [Chroococcales cyanobacterium]